MVKNYVWENKTLRINKQRRATDGTNQESWDRRMMVLDGIILKPYDRRQNSDPSYKSPERRNEFGRRSIFDRREHYALWLQSKNRLITKAA